MKRYLVVGYITKGAGEEFSAISGRVLSNGEAVPSYTEIRKDCLDWVNRDKENPHCYFQINFMKFLSREDYVSFMGSEVKK